MGDIIVVWRRQRAHRPQADDPPSRQGISGLDEEYLAVVTNAVSLMVIYDMMGRSKSTWSQAIGHVHTSPRAWRLRGHRA